MFDLGGGTFDVTLMNLSEGTLDVTATRGNSHLGGRDLDNMLMEHCVEELKKKGVDISGNRKARAKLRL